MTITMYGLTVLQAFTVPGILSTLVIIGIILIIGRFLLNIAFKAVILAAIVAGVLWLLGSESILPMILV